MVSETGIDPAACGCFETIAYVYSQSDLALLMSLFESEDIGLVAVGRLHVAVDPGIATALGGVELRVHAEDGEDARKVLAGLPDPYREPVTAAFALLMVLLALLLAGPPPRAVPCFVGVAAGRDS